MLSVQFGAVLVEGGQGREIERERGSQKSVDSQNRKFSSVQFGEFDSVWCNPVYVGVENPKEIWLLDTLESTKCCMYSRKVQVLDLSEYMSVHLDGDVPKDVKSSIRGDSLYSLGLKL